MNIEGPALGTVSLESIEDLAARVAAGGPAVVLPVGVPDGWLGNAFFFAALAYPDEPARRVAFVRAAGARFRREAIRRGFASRSQFVGFPDVRPRDIDRQLDMVCRRLSGRVEPSPEGAPPIGRRIVAALFAQSIELHNGFTLTSDNPQVRNRPQLSVQRLAKGHAALAGGLVDNVRQRIWYETAPVLHLARAWMLSPRIGPKAVPDVIDDAIDAPGWLEDVLAGAEHHRRSWRLMAIPELRDKGTIRLLPAA